MAIIKDADVGSANVQGEALKVGEVQKYTNAAVWDLKSTEAMAPSPESTIVLHLKNPEPTLESVVDGGDERVKVDARHFAPGGKYRSIVKLFVHYEDQDKGGWSMGSGWLIAPDIFVTAGHCSFDQAYQMGRATEVKAYIGYNGRQSATSRDVQFRYVKRIVTTEGWLKAKDSKPYDVSFMQVNKPFTGITSIRPEETPANGLLSLGVVGYPGDKQDPITKENGAQMYEMYHLTKFDLSRQSDHMLEYLIDTFGGNSGSPVLKQSDTSDQVSIGTHVYGGRLNSASVIGQYGQNYDHLLSILGAELPKDYQMHIVSLETAKLSGAPHSSGWGLPRKALVSNGSRVGKMTPKQNSASTVGKNRRYEPDEEGFFGDVLGFVGPVLPVIGGPFGALAGAAINAAGHLLGNSTGSESLMDALVLRQGSVERAILAEATLTALQSGALHPDTQESILQDIKAMAAKALPVIRKVVPSIMGAMMEPALKIALQSLEANNKTQKSGHESFAALPATSLPVTTYTDAIDKPSDQNVEAFINRINDSLVNHLQAESAIDNETQEGFFDIIRAGARLGQGVLKVTKVGLPLLVNFLDKSTPAGAESYGEQIGLDPDTQHHTAYRLAKRAVVADAALHTVMKLPADQLEEGWFDSVANAVKKIAPVVLKAAPAVAKAIDPTVGKVVSSLLGQESAPCGGSLSAPTGGSRGPPTGGSRGPPTGGSRGPPIGGSMLSPADGSMNYRQAHSLTPRVSMASLREAANGYTTDGDY